MKVLIIHNRYASGSPSGENVVVDEEIALLEEMGCEVIPYLRSSDEIQEMSLSERVLLAARPVWSPSALREVQRLLAAARPDVMHLHNPFPLISPAVVKTCHRAGVPVVQTVHNYRHVCMAGTYFRDGRSCEDCVGHSVPWPGAVHGCYRGSTSQSLVMATALTAHRKTWHLVSRFLALSGFMRDHLVRAGIRADRISIKPNSTADPGPPSYDGEGILFAGRLSEAKGIPLLLEAWRSAGARAGRLTIVGDGPDRALVTAAAAADASIVYLDQVAPHEISQLIRAHAALVVPSLWYEGYPRIIAETFAHGRPVVTMNLGSLPQIVDEAVGWVADLTAPALADALSKVHLDWVDRGRAARQRFEDTLSREAVGRSLLESYAAVRSQQ